MPVTFLLCPELACSEPVELSNGLLGVSVPQAKRVVKIFKFCGILDAKALEVHQSADAP
jgi:hypothetical protein